MIREKMLLSGKETSSEQNYIYSMLDEIKKADIPCVMYGTGGMAKYLVGGVFKAKGVSVDYFVESENYFNHGKMVFGKEVYLLNQLKDRIGEFNLVVATSDVHVQMGLKRLGRDDSQIREVYIFPYPKTHYDMTADWVYENADKLDVTFNMLADDESKQVMLSAINAHAFCIDTDYVLTKLWTEQAYFNTLYSKGSRKENVFVDCGAYDGDSVIAYFEFLKSRGELGEAFAFEPWKEAFIKLKDNTKEFASSIHYYPYACGKKPSVQYFEIRDMGSRLVDYPTDCKVEVIKGDEILLDREISMIKMDIEGAEMDALTGMSETIKKQKPMLAVCVYHKIDDLISIPQKIYELGKDDYNYYLKHHSYGVDDTVFYAVPV